MGPFKHYPSENQRGEKGRPAERNLKEALLPDFRKPSPKLLRDRNSSLLSFVAEAPIRKVLSLSPMIACKFPFSSSGSLLLFCVGGVLLLVNGLSAGDLLSPSVISNTYDPLLSQAEFETVMELDGQAMCSLAESLIS